VVNFKAVGRLPGDRLSRNWEANDNLNDDPVPAALTDYNRGGISGTQGALAYALNLPANGIADGTDAAIPAGQVTFGPNNYNLNQADQTQPNSPLALTKAVSRTNNPLDDAI
jgi:hypothetical protein